MKTFTTLLIFLVITPIGLARACDDPEIPVRKFVDIWNERTRKVSIKTWQLKLYTGSGDIRQTVETGLLLRVTADQNGCLVKAELASRRKGNERPDGLAALFGWISLIAATNPTLSPPDQQAILSRLAIDKPNAGGTVTLNGMTYAFVEDEDTNSFTVAAARSERPR
jgi:hypothetical protein